MFGNPNFTAGPFVTWQSLSGELSSLLGSMHIHGNNDNDIEHDDDGHTDGHAPDIAEENGQGKPLGTESNKENTEVVTQGIQTEADEIEDKVSFLKEQLIRLETVFSEAVTTVVH